MLSTTFSIAKGTTFCILNNFAAAISTTRGNWRAVLVITTQGMGQCDRSIQSTRRNLTRIGDVDPTRYHGWY
jgi:uncharacterized membrane protein